MSSYFHPVKFFCCEWIIGIFIKLFSFGQMTLGKLAGTGYVPDLHMIFVLSFSNATAYRLDDPNKAFARFHKYQIKDTGNINTHSSHTIGGHNNLVRCIRDFGVFTLSILGFGSTTYEYRFVSQSFNQCMSSSHSVY